MKIQDTIRNRKREQLLNFLKERRRINQAVRSQSRRRPLLAIGKLPLPKKSGQSSLVNRQQPVTASNRRKERREKLLSLVLHQKEEREKARQLAFQRLQAERVNQLKAREAKRAEEKKRREAERVEREKELEARKAERARLRQEKVAARLAQ
ncbi:MAG: hypothetical protein NC911_06300, partial [Candidatus Omnitrophica bacterium]|nr:hypothetical protein [Candidatus Omnitrophota bacterium]